MGSFDDLLPPLETLEWLHGSPSNLTHDLRLALLIQPNCPGCHTHALPVANELFLEAESPQHDFDVYCISTAFEDFSYNTLESTKKLLQGETVGVTRQQLGPKAPNVPLMPMAHDVIVAKQDASPELLDMALRATREQAAEQLANGCFPPGQIEQMLASVGPQLLPSYLGTVFYASRAQGTPTWVLHTRNGKVLASQTGPMSESDLLEWIASNSKK